MTNEEAIKILESWLAVFVHDDDGTDADAREMTLAIPKAISALRAQEKYHIGDVTEMIENWISVEDRLPNEGANVLVYIPFRGSHLHYVSYMESGLWYVPTMYGRSSLNDITHWMPLPQPPEVEK